MKKNIQKNKKLRGDVLLLGIFAIILVTLVGAGILSVISYLNKESRIARIKGVMRESEQAALQILLNPSSYQESPPASGVYNFIALFPSSLLNKQILGARCPTAAPCGVEMQNYIAPTAANGEVFTATFTYTGIDTKVVADNYSIVVPSPSLFISGDTCTDPTTPLFAGMNNAGHPICKAITPCPLGQVATGFNSTTRALTCVSLPSFSCPTAASVPTASCPSGFCPLIGSQYTNGNRLPAGAQLNCVAEFDPFQVWGHL